MAMFNSYVDITRGYPNTFVPWRSHLPRNSVATPGSLLSNTEARPKKQQGITLSLDVDVYIWIYLYHSISVYVCSGSIFIHIYIHDYNVQMCLDIYICAYVYICNHVHQGNIILIPRGSINGGFMVFLLRTCSTIPCLFCFVVCLLAFNQHIC